MSFLSRLINAMRLEDDTPEPSIVTTVSRTEMCTSYNHILELSVRTRLEELEEFERRNHCLQLIVKETPEIFMSNITDVDHDMIELVKYYLADPSSSTIGLIGLDVKFDRTELIFAPLKKLRGEYSYYIDNRKNMTYSVKVPDAIGSIRDCYIGEYDEVSITGQCHHHRGDNVAINYCLDHRSVCMETVFPCPNNPLGYPIERPQVEPIFGPPNQLLLIESVRFTHSYRHITPKNDPVINKGRFSFQLTSIACVNRSLRRARRLRQLPRGISSSLQLRLS